MRCADVAMSHGESLASQGRQKHSKTKATSNTDRHCLHIDRHHIQIKRGRMAAYGIHCRIRSQAKLQRIHGEAVGGHVGECGPGLGDGTSSMRDERVATVARTGDAG